MSMLFVEYQDKKIKMLKSIYPNTPVCENCHDCPLAAENNSYGYFCWDFERMYPEEAEKIIENYKIFNKSEWLKEIKEKYNKKSVSKLQFLYSGHMTLCIIKGKKDKVGIAKCKPSDKFNIEIGNAIAYCRAKGIEIPKKILKGE